MLHEISDRTPARLKVRLHVEDETRRNEIREVLSRTPDLNLEISDNGAGESILDLPEEADVTMVAFGTDGVAADFFHDQNGAAAKRSNIALLDNRSPEQIRSALRAGADEVLFLPLDPFDVTRALLKIGEMRRRAQGPGGGKVISIASLTGGAGVTSIAANLAMALKRSHAQRVALVDFDLQSSDLSVLLNLEPDHTIGDLIDTDAKLDSIRLEYALSRHSSGVYLLAAPKRLEDGDRLTPVQAGAILDLMRQLFDVVVIDTGRYINENSVAAWERSDHLIYVLNQSISAARSAWRFFDLFGKLNLPAIKLSLLLNRLSPKNPISEQRISETLGRAVTARIPRDDAAFERMAMEGIDPRAAGASSMLAKSFEELASLAMGVPLSISRDRNDGWLTRIFKGAAPQI